tara:strand:- start:3139 stop:4110 length:972 start_codon:yes stop_codon:yes gene_type:complete
MDDYSITSITESKNEWCARLLNVLTPCLIEGIKSVFEEAYNMCIENDEEDKYLMTFQNLLNNIPKWSMQIVDTEKDRIVASSGCNYLEDLLTCVHITQLKSLTVARAGLKQKKVDIDIPNISIFLHKAYINIARKVYVNVYLFEKDIMPLQIQKNNRELETIVKECILNTIRDNIPVEDILKLYLDETQETDVEIEEQKEEIIDKEAIAKMEKQRKEEELAAIKEDVKKKLEEETKVNDAIKSANKSLNSDLTNDDTSDLESEAENEILNLNPIDDSDDKLDLNIESLDNDPDKLELDILDLDDKPNPKKEEFSDIDLGIEEL